MEPLSEKYLRETASGLAAETGLTIPPGISYDMLETLLAQQLEELVSHNFQQFVLLLYRVDVAEDKVRQVMETDISPDAYRKLAALLIERQYRKVADRAAYRQPPADDGEEKW